MSVQISSSKDLQRRLGIDKQGKVQKFLVNTAYKMMDKYVPMDRGDLRSNVSIGKDKIVYESPYAHAQYVGYTTGPVNNYTTPGTGTYWDKKMMSAEKSKLIKTVQNYIDGGK